MDSLPAKEYLPPKEYLFIAFTYGVLEYLLRLYTCSGSGEYFISMSWNLLALPTLLSFRYIHCSTPSRCFFWALSLVRFSLMTRSHQVKVRERGSANLASSTGAFFWV